MQVKKALVDISKLLKPGGKLFFYEPHVLEYMNKNAAGHVHYYPKDDGTDYKYFDDEGTPRKVSFVVKLQLPLAFIDRIYTRDIRVLPKVLQRSESNVPIWTYMQGAWHSKSMMYRGLGRKVKILSARKAHILICVLLPATTRV